VKKTTAWLKRNQVWFTAIAATILTLASVWVGYQQMRVADLQAKIAQAQALPVFEIHIEQVKDETSGLYKNSHLEVDCVEGRAFRFSGDSAYFLDFISVPDKPSFNSVRLQVPVGGYFTISFVTAATKGRLLTQIGNNNNETFGTLARALRDNPDHSVIIEERVYFHSTYDDLLGRQHSEYFRIGGISGPLRLTDAEGKKLFDEWYDPRLRVELAQITPDWVYSKLNAVADRK
jgi:hypothetical protein